MVIDYLAMPTQIIYVEKPVEKTVEKNTPIYATIKPKSYLWVLAAVVLGGVLLLKK